MVIRGIDTLHGDGVRVIRGTCTLWGGGARLMRYLESLSDVHLKIGIVMDMIEVNTV